MEVKDNWKWAVDQIKKFEASKAVPSESESNTSTEVPLKKSSETDVLPSCKQQGK